MSNTYTHTTSIYCMFQGIERACLGFITLLYSSTGRTPSSHLFCPLQDCIVCLFLFLLHLSAKVKGERELKRVRLLGGRSLATKKPNFSSACHIFTIPSLSLNSLQDGLVKANMEKLTFYALSAPEKLDRIGAYLSERLSRDVARHRYG